MCDLEYSFLNKRIFRVCIIVILSVRNKIILDVHPFGSISSLSFAGSGRLVTSWHNTARALTGAAEQAVGSQEGNESGITLRLLLSGVLGCRARQPSTLPPPRFQNPSTKVWPPPCQAGVECTYQCPGGAQGTHSWSSDRRGFMVASRDRSVMEWIASTH